GIVRAGGKYLCLLNSDVTVPTGCLPVLLAYMEAHPRVGMVGPQMRAPSGEIRRSTMRFPTLVNTLARSLALDSLFHCKWPLFGQLMPDFAHTCTTDVDVLNGWFVLVRREALQQVALLDERFFF